MLRVHGTIPACGMGRIPLKLVQIRGGGYLTASSPVATYASWSVICHRAGALVYRDYLEDKPALGRGPRRRGDASSVPPKQESDGTAMTETKPSTTNEGAPELYPVLPLRDIVVFPYMIVPLVRGPREVDRRPRRGDAIRQADPARRAEERLDDEPSTEGIYQMGTLASVLQLLKLPDGTVKVLVEGTRRAVHQALYRERELFRGRDRARRGDRRRRGRDRGACPLRRLAVRELREAEQEDLARGARHR